MKKLKILYVDVPFLGFTGGDKNRSRFLYESLSSNYDTDILLIQNKEYSAEQIDIHKKGNKLYTINSKKTPFYKSEAVYDFDTDNIEIFKQILKSNTYDSIFFRFASTSTLAQIASQTSVLSKIVIDVDMLFSQIAKEAWRTNKSIKNRYYLFEYLKLYNFEKKFFNNKYIFLYTNKNELELVKEKYLKRENKNHFVLPNVINKIDIPRQVNNIKQNILFYGVLNSIANTSAYKFLVEDIYPLIKNTLEQENILINIVGKGKNFIHQNPPKNINIVGEVDDIVDYIYNSKFVLLPLTVASGTLTRIIEAAYLKKCIVTTTTGAEGLNMDQSLVIKDNPKDIASSIIKLITDRKSCEQYGNNAHNEVVKQYLNTSVAQKLFTIIDTKYPKVNALHVPRRFTKSHWGGTENVLLSQANGLKKYNVQPEIITSNILCDISTETIEDIEVKRCNYFYPYFNLKNNQKKQLDLVAGNLFSWELFFHLLFKKDIDIIHLHTAKRMGSIIRFICKIRKIPYVVSVHGGVYDISDGERKNRMKPTENCFEWGKILGFLFGSRKVYDDADKIITLNTNEYESMVKRYGESKVLLLPNSINVSQFNIIKDESFREKYSIKHDSFVFLVSARIDKQKNQLLVLKAFKTLQNEYENIHLMIVGNITDVDYYKELTTFIDIHKLHDIVTLKTNLKPNSNELINCYLNSNAFVLASIHEPFGIVGLEAWASGLPLIVSDISGICNILKDQQDALVFKSGSESELLSQMKKLYINKSLYNSIVLNAYKSIQNYDNSVINEKIYSIYKGLIF
mgnify:FL=1